jgi:hypothetical protein
MRRFTARGLAVAALTAAALGAAAAADKPADSPWYSRVLGKSEPKPADPPTFGSAPAPARPPAVVGPLDPVAQADALRAEQDAWQRRMDVCLKLRQVAAARNDEALATRADELERQATALYQQRVARIGVKSPGRPEADIAAEPRRPSEPPARQFREVKP